MILSVRPGTRARRGESLVEAIVALALLSGTAVPALSALRVSLRSARAADAALRSSLALHPALREAQGRALLGEALPELSLRDGGMVQVRAERVAADALAAPGGAGEVTAMMLEARISRAAPASPARPFAAQAVSAAKSSCAVEGLALSSASLFCAAPVRGLQCPSTDNFSRELMAR